MKLVWEERSEIQRYKGPASREEVLRVSLQGGKDAGSFPSHIQHPPPSTPSCSVQILYSFNLSSLAHFGAHLGGEEVSWASFA